MKQFYYLLVILFALSFQSCRNNLNMPVPASRNYQQDAAVLNDFVDINKTTHEYYINPNKKKFRAILFDEYRCGRIERCKSGKSE